MEVVKAGGISNLREKSVFTRWPNPQSFVMELFDSERFYDCRWAGNTHRQTKREMLLI